MVNFCPHCGREVGINDAYCPGCGMSLNITTATSTATPDRTPHATWLGIAEILTGLWVIIAILLAVVMFVGSGWIGDDAFFFAGSLLGVCLLLSALCAAVAAYNIKNRKHSLRTILLLIVAGLCGIGWFSIAMSVLMALVVILSSEDFH